MGGQSAGHTNAPSAKPEKGGGGKKEGIVPPSIEGLGGGGGASVGRRQNPRGIYFRPAEEIYAEKRPREGCSYLANLAGIRTTPGNP